MDAIRNYLESMFMNLPNTPEVQKAKYELGQMMEDKYNELIKEGKTENEAVGTVISEFGNLDEIADDLGLRSVLSAPEVIARRLVSLQEIKQFFADKSRQAYMVALGVMLCILSPVGCIFGDSFGGNAGEAIGVVLLFVMIAVGVAMFIMSGALMKKWEYLKNESCGIDFETSNFVHNEKENNRMMHALLITIGVILCIVSSVPAAVIGIFAMGNIFLDELSGALVLIFVAIGVFLIIMAAMRSGSFDEVLKLNGAGTVGGSYVTSQAEEHYSSRTAEVIMQVFWPTTTCIYLCWSFLTFEWGITWIIWPVAAVLHTLLKNILKGA